mgnify:CR=1 FL=1
MQRQARAAEEPFVITKTEHGYRVCSPRSPGNQYLVTDTGDEVTCTCPDFERNAADPEWRCKHMIAVAAQTTGAKAEQAGDASTAHVAANTGREPHRGNGNSTESPALSRILIKRSVSPDGHIDSLSVEFSAPLRSPAAEGIREEAKSILRIQSDIIADFLAANRPRRSEERVNGGGVGPVEARLLSISGMEGRYGRRLFLNVLVNGRIAKLFGSHKQLADALDNAGFGEFGQQIAEGVELNLPCRVVTKPTPDGRFLNVEKVLPPSNGSGTSGGSQ